MSNINVTPGTGKTVATETLAGIEYQQIKLVGGETGSTSVLGVNPDRSINVSVIGIIKTSGSVSGTVGASVIGTVPVTFAGNLTIGSVIGAAPMYAQSGSYTSGAPSVITGTASVVVLASPGAALRNYVTHILVSNNAAVSTVVNIVDNGQVIYTGVAASQGGGFSATLPTPLKQPTTNLALYAQTPTQASVLVSMSGYVAP